MLKGLCFVLSGKLSLSRKEFENLIAKNGGSSASSVTKKTTHLITTKDDFEAGQNSKINAAVDLGLHIVCETFVTDSIKKGRLESEADHGFSESNEKSAKKKKPMVDYSGLKFILEPSIHDKYKSFIEERNGIVLDPSMLKDMSKIDYSQDLRVICEKEKFMDVYPSVNSGLKVHLKKNKN